MTQKVYHGSITPDDLANALVGEFNRGDLRVTRSGNAEQISLNISTPQSRAAGGNTSLAVLVKKYEDGIMVQMGEQEWIGLAASFGQTALETLQNPWNLLHRLDDIAADVNSIQLPEKVWMAIDRCMKTHSASLELSERLRTTACPYCNTANAVGAASCVQCGAPLGDAQPGTCADCGFVNVKEAKFCANCGHKLWQEPAAT